MSFFSMPTLELAKALLGKIIVRRIKVNGKVVILSGMIVETEGYRGFGDKASHAFRGVTKRNAAMFGFPGTLYVYLTYGIYYMANVVSAENGIGEAVLIRALKPVNGIDAMRKHRPIVKDLYQLANGPGKLTKALSIDIALNGISLCGNQVYILDGPRTPCDKIVTTSRVGISRSKELPWRFFIKDSPYISRAKPSL